MNNINHLLKRLVNSPTLIFAVRSGHREIFPWLRDLKSRHDVVLKPATNELFERVHDDTYRQKLD
jgi:hypothetical protein